MVLTKIAAYCTNRFVDMNRQYDQRHNPQIKLEEYKDTAFKLFVDLVHKKTEDVIASNFFQEAIKSCILEQVEEEIPNKVKSEILNSFEYSKYEVMKSVMKDLVDKNSFDHFSVRTVVEQLETTRKSVLQTVTETNIETVRWKTDPYTSIFKRLWGCCATCPFCSEPCQYNDGHLVNVKHSCRQHRPQGVGDYAWEKWPWGVSDRYMQLFNS
ncbi:unnamed protein product [Mytilus edulis]|uniref:Interferon-induced very large GTPase 1-like n=1 Tax=Mytilus edulis TaxID=6550 RepID=A0A8S3V2G1_MYTED|nr:unnamed protein product [Mytilus edulis]